MARISDKLIQVVSKAVPTQPLARFGRRSPVLSPRLDKRLVQFASANSIGFMRISLAIIFLWFGLLKLVHPASEFGMVIGTTYWFPLAPKFLVPLLGISEILLGVAVLFAVGVLLRLALLFLLLHLLATFVVLFLMPDLAFHNGNPLLLTSSGEYVIKNLVLLAAVVVVFASTIDSEKRAYGKSASGNRVNGHKKDRVMKQGGPER